MLTRHNLYEAFDASRGDEQVFYVSVPITSGPREVDLLDKFDTRSVEALRAQQKDLWFSEVQAPNEVEAGKLAAEIRQRHPSRIVVDPAKLNVPGWEQRDYLSFWTEFIRQRVATVFVSNDWAWSRGARAEVALALELGLPVRTAVDDVLGADEARATADAAIEALVDRGWSLDEATEYLPLYGTVPRAEPSAAAEAFEWLAGERKYQLTKFGLELDDEHTAAGIDQSSWWWQQLMNYLHRAHVLGLDTPVGRQALAKFTATACGLLESAVRVYGPLPEPAVSSGEIVYRERPHD